ncbi:MAG: MMPL family transporter, partial [Holophagales bacterium]|nr:MMPL family transporter [Holophagales bacterium]
MNEPRNEAGDPPDAAAGRAGGEPPAGAPKAAPSRFWTRLLYHRRRVAIGIGLLALVLLPGFLSLETDNSPSVFFVRGSSAVERYGEMRRVFGSDESLRLVFEGPDLWRQRSLVWLGEVEDQAAQLPGVARVSGLYGHYRRDRWPPVDIAAFRAEIQHSPLDRGAGWVGKDGEVITVLVQLEVIDQPAERRLLAGLEAILEEAPEGVTSRIVGLPVLNRELDLSSQEIERRFFPLLILFTLALLFSVIRRFAEVGAILAFVGLCQLLALSTMGWAGARLNLVSSILPPLIFVISLATAVHVLLRFRSTEDPAGARGGALAAAASAPPPEEERESVSRHRRVLAVMAEKGWSVFWTGATTLVGFASLAISPVAPVRSLGMWASVGIALATAAALFALPVLLASFGGRPVPRQSGGFETWLGHLGERLGRWACRHRLAVLAATAAVAGVLLLGLPHIEVESNALRYLAADHPLRAGIDQLEAHEIGAATVELLVTLPASEGGAPPPFVSAIEVERLADLGADLEQLVGIYGVVNAGVVLRDAVRRVPSTPTNAHMRAQMVLEGMSQDAQGREVLEAFLSADRLTARSTLFVATVGADELEALIARVVEMVRLQFPEAEVETTGEYPLLLEAQSYLLSTLAASLALTLLVVGVVLRFLLPSNRLAFLALVPNLWPVMGAVGAMGWLGVPLDIATVMMASVALGLAVDDTVHTLGHFRRWAPRVGSAEAVGRTLRVTAPAYVLTGLILMAGFGVCGLSDFAPIARFGGLSALAIGLAVIGDLVLL